MVAPLMLSATVQSFTFTGFSSWKDLPQQLRLELLILPFHVFWKDLKTIWFAGDSTDLSWERL